MRAVISVLGKDRPGILAFVSTRCANNQINIVDVTQKVLQDVFTMVMIVDIPEEDSANFHQIVADFEKAGEKEGLQIHMMHDGIFSAMHTI